MGFVCKSVGVEELALEFDQLGQHFSRLAAKLGKRTRIESTKLGHYQREMKNMNGLSAAEVAKLLGVVRKYCAIKVVFDAPSQFKITDQQLFELLQGRPIINDDNESYNDKFFEVALAARLVAALGPTAVADLSTVCDVICNDFAVECKYVHSKRSLRELFGTGMSQLKDRFDSGLAKKGMVAIDLSNVLDKARIEAFFRHAFDLFRDGYEQMEAGRGAFSQSIKNKGIAMSVATDRNFGLMVSNFVSHEMEAFVYSTLTRHDLDKLDNERVGIFFQSTQYFCIEHDGDLLPIPCRGAIYHISPALSPIANRKLVRRIHASAVGF